MYLKILLFTCFIVIGMSANISAQKAVRFSSVYSNLTKHCEEIPGENGSDGASICRGASGYQVRLYYSAATTQINAEKLRSDGFVGLATLDIGYDSSKTVFEWRLANGVPFAVIMRVPVYAEPKPGEYFGKVIGQQLKVIGLVGYDIAETINATLPKANVLAREAADKAYKPRTK